MSRVANISLQKTLCIEMHQLKNWDLEKFQIHCFQKVQAQLVCKARSKEPVDCILEWMVILIFERQWNLKKFNNTFMIYLIWSLRNNNDDFIGSKENEPQNPSGKQESIFISQESKYLERDCSKDSDYYSLRVSN